MMQLEHEYDDVLRRVLHAAADLVEPSPDGLERIRARLTPPQPALIAWLLAGYSDLIRPARGWAQSAVNWAQPVLNWLRPFLERLQPVLDWLRVALGPVIERFRPARPDAAHPQRRYAWLRPAAAMGTAVFVVAMGAFALTALPQVISSSNVFVLPFTGGGSGGQAGVGGVNGHGAPLPPGQVFASGVSPGSQSPRTEVAPTCSVAPSPAPSGATASPSPSTVPPPASPSPSTAPPPTTPPPTTPVPTSPSPSASPSPSPSASNSDPAPPPSSPAPADSSDAQVLAVSPAVAVTLDAAPGPSSPAAAPCGPAPTKPPPTRGTRATRGNAQAKLG
jgi:hypothetical protein